MAAQFAPGQSFSPITDFQAMTLAQLETFQAKVTYFGPQEGPMPSLVILSNSGTLDMTRFVPFRRPGLSYVNDTLRFDVARATTAQLDALIDQVATVPAVAAGGVASAPFVSFSMVNSQPSVKGFEAVLNTTDAVALFERIKTALAGNSDARAKASFIGCSMGLFPAGVPTDVTSGVAVTVSGARRNRVTGRFLVTVTARNLGASAITGPISVFLVFGGSLTIFNPTGVGCALQVGTQYIDPVLTSNQLGGAASVLTNIELVNPLLEPIRVTTFKVYAGAGAR